MNDVSFTLNFDLIVRRVSVRGKYPSLVHVGSVLCVKDNSPVSQCDVK